jgi:hypothetical protein
MNDESLEFIESRLAALHPLVAPRELRGAVLADVRRELRAARWDRRLARVAAVLLAVGVGLNLAIGLQSTGSSHGQPPRVAHSDARQSLLDTAVVVAEATDAATGSRYARQLAAMSGRELTADEAAAIDAAVERAATHATTNGNKG